jgi:hypothetical protein
LRNRKFNETQGEYDRGEYKIKKGTNEGGGMNAGEEMNARGEYKKTLDEYRGANECKRT